MIGAVEANLLASDWVVGAKQITMVKVKALPVKILMLTLAFA